MILTVWQGVAGDGLSAGLNIRLKVFGYMIKESNLKSDGIRSNIREPYKRDCRYGEIHLISSVLTFPPDYPLGSWGGHK